MMHEEEMDRQDAMIQSLSDRLKECDPWYPASERKPKPEDFEPTGYIQLWLGKDSIEISKTALEHGDWSPTHWRRISPPTK